MNDLLRLIRKPLQYRTYRYSVISVIIVINIVVFLLMNVNKSMGGLIALNPQLFLNGRYWTVVTYMFAHASISHIFFNMLALYFFGTVIERTWGSNEFILLYGLIGILSGTFSLVFYLVQGNMYVFMLGASGAVYGVMLIFACMYPHQRIYVFGVFPVTAKVLMLIFIGIELFSSLSGRTGQTNVAYFTHLSGIGVAWLYLLLRHRINPYKRLLDR